MLIKGIISHYADIIVAVFFKNNVWYLRRRCISQAKNKYLDYLYYSYLRKFGAWIGLGADIATPPHIASWATGDIY